MFDVPDYQIEPTPEGQLGWLIQDQRGRTIAHYVYKDEAMAAVRELSCLHFSFPVIGSLSHEPSMFLG
jgi:hypothetical protein